MSDENTTAAAAPAGGVDAAKEHALKNDTPTETEAAPAFDAADGGGNADGATMDTETGEAAAADATATDEDAATTDEAAGPEAGEQEEGGTPTEAAE